MTDTQAMLIKQLRIGDRISISDTVVAVVAVVVEGVLDRKECFSLARPELTLVFLSKGAPIT